MSEERPQHTQEPAEGNNEDVEAPGAEQAGADPGTSKNTDEGSQPSIHPQESAEGEDEDVEAPGVERAGDAG